MTREIEHECPTCNGSGKVYSKRSCLHPNTSRANQACERCDDCGATRLIDNWFEYKYETAVPLWGEWSV